MHRANPEYYYILGLYETYVMICAKEYGRVYNQAEWFHLKTEPWNLRIRYLMQLTNE